MEAYCMKCKEKREAKDVKDVTMKNGKPAQEGVCPVCGTKMFRIGAAKPTAKPVAKSAEAEKAPAKVENDGKAPVKAKGATKAKSAAK